MQDSLSTIQTKTSVGSHMGPGLLLGAFAALLFKCAPAYFPLMAAAFLGYVLTRFAKKRGLMFSLLGLAIASFFTVRFTGDFFWPLLLAACIALSCSLILWGDQEAASLFNGKEEEIATTREHLRGIEKQLLETKASLAEATSSLEQVQGALEASEKERVHLVQNYLPPSCGRCELLSQELLSTQKALEEAKLPSSSALIVAEDDDSEETFRQQYTLLREQFAEKSEALEKTRKELFKTENALLALQKAWEERDYGSFEEECGLIQDLKALEEERAQLETHAAALQELVSSVFFSDKPLRPRKEKKTAPNEESLPLLLQEKIDSILTS